MPSVHVATTLLFALSARSSYPRIAALLFVYTGVIWVGSVHLAWHYAVDGLLSILLVVPLWRFTTWLVDRLLEIQRSYEMRYSEG